MMNVGLRTRIKPGAEDRYEAYHREVWPAVVKAIRDAGISKYVIFRDGLDVFHYIECEDYNRAVAQIAHDPVSMKWEAEIATLMEATHDFSGESSDRLQKIWEL